MAEPFKTYRTASGRSISQTLAQYGEAGAKSLGKQLYREGLGIMAQSEPLCPVDTGTLKASGYVQPPEIIEGGQTIRVEIGYGGPAAKINPKTGQSADGYALFVHENLEAHHPVGTAKYLEIPFNAAKPGMEDRIVAGMRIDLKMKVP